jgi:alpha-D-xyloside xylohydrolase
MSKMLKTTNSIIYKSKGETLKITAWGPDAVRVQATRRKEIRDDLPGALLAPEASEVVIEENEHDGLSLTNGLLKARFGSMGTLAFERTDEGRILLEEPFRYWSPISSVPARHYRPDGESQNIRVEFKPQDERIWGMGQQRHGFLDHKGTSFNLMHINGEFTVPFYVSSAGYGFLWNHPGIGSVSFSNNRTVWESNDSQQIDYWVVTGDRLKSILASYVRATGLPPVPPERMSGYWQCKLRYKTQDEVLEVARTFKEKNIPIDIIIIDYFHWTEMGDYRFDPECFPDPEAMVAELKEMGIEVVVSIWPAISEHSENLARVEDGNLMIGCRRGMDYQRRLPRHFERDEKPEKMSWEHMHFLDFTNPDTADWIWDTVKQNYYDKGIRHFWLDASEPATKHFDFGNLEYFLGSGDSVGCIYPNKEVEAFVKGLDEEGEKGLLLSRCLWAGGQRYGAAVWSGDINSSFDEMRRQVLMSLHASMSGLHLWHADCGGFRRAGLDCQSDEFHELIIRWLQWSVYQPVCRMHGNRPVNEPWSFGSDVEEILTKWIRLRYELKPYILEEMKKTSQTGVPLVRPLWIEHQDDPACLDIADEFRFGDRFLVAPVLEYKARSRSVYLPKGAEWYDAWSGERYEGGQWMECEAPLDRMPVFLCNSDAGVLKALEC